MNPKTFALSAQTAEPRYLNIYNLLNNIGASYLDQHYPKEAEGYLGLQPRIAAVTIHGKD